MPEGHSVHRIALQFRRNFVGERVAVSSPQGRFSADAALIDGHIMTDARAIGKQLFLAFDNGLWLRVHLGLYGAWDFAGEITVDDTIRSARGRMGQTNQHGTVFDPAEQAQREDGLRAATLLDSRGEDSIASMGAPRRARLRMSESEKEDDSAFAFPPEPVGAVRARLLTETAVADLRGPTACRVIDEAQMAEVIAGLGPDPLVDDGPEVEDRVADVITSKQTPVGMLLMDQSVMSGIGNVYRAEMLFRARLNPHTPGKKVPRETAKALWRDWAQLLDIGVRTGQMMTMDDLTPEDWTRAMASREDRHWVYKREGLPCRVCGTHIVMEVMGARKLYWCPNCQA